MGSVMDIRTDKLETMRAVSTEHESQTQEQSLF